MKITCSIKLKTTLLLCFHFSFLVSFSQNTHLSNLINSSQWDTLFPKRAGTTASHPQGYTTDFYSYNNFNTAVNEMADYFVVIRTKPGVWGQLIDITRKSNLQTYNYSNVDSWWFSNTTPESIVIVDFAQFLNESSSTNNKRELAAFFANISKETTGGWQLPVGSGLPGDYAFWGLYFVHEVGYSSATSAGTYSQSHSEFPPDSTVGYYGRGPIQLSWNYNYGQFSKFIYNNKNILLNYPDSIQENGVLAFKSAIWFWMMPQCPKPSCHQVMHDLWLHDSAYSAQRMYYKGFAHTNNIINGGLECRTNSSSAFTQKVVLRSKLYKYYLELMGFTSSEIAHEDSADYSTLCYSSSTDAMQDYVNCKTNNSFIGSFSIDSQLVCGPFEWIDGETYTTSTKTVFHNVSNQNGLDSLVLLHLVVNPISNSIDTQTACELYTWIDDSTYTESTDTAFYIVQDGAANGCDSIVNLKLIILKPSLVTDTQTACELYTWIDDSTYTESTDTAFYIVPSGAANGCDSIVNLKLTILKPSLVTDAQTACELYTWIDDSTYTESTDAAFYIVPGGAANGCDSVIFLNLKIVNIDRRVIQDSTMLKASHSNASYQWLNCENGFQPIEGEVNQTFFPKVNGKYAVIITTPDCVDTSDCYSFSLLSFEKNNLQSNFTIFPNPCSRILIISNASKIEKLEFINSVGQKVYTSINNSEQIQLDVSDFVPGLYSIEIHSENSVFTSRIIIKKSD